MPVDPSIESAADLILCGFEDYQHRFAEITQRARGRFETRDWQGAQRDALERLGLYGDIVDTIDAGTRTLLGEHLHRTDLWAEIKAAFAAHVDDSPIIEIAETFFNSVTRRVFDTVGVDPRIEFVAPPVAVPHAAVEEAVFETIPIDGSIESAVKKIISRSEFKANWNNLDRDVRLAAQEIECERARVLGDRELVAVDVISPVFYRGQRAFIVGRLRAGERVMPIVLALAHDAGGVEIDAVLLTENEASIVFSFTRSYFHVELDRPRDMIAFLKSIMPLKPVAELYTALGFNKHGKTELYRDLLFHMDRSTDLFEIARGDRGLVMIVFTLPSYDLVFKIIRDHFAPPKTITRREVMDKYQLVFRHDRAGRLVDAQEFEHLKFARNRFSESLLTELASNASRSVTISERFVHFAHLYTERRITPLNLYLREEEEELAVEAALDYGRAIKNLAATNIFPGDLLLKNFGVTRHGRVIFYDYDELCPLTDCRFRTMPPAQYPEDEMRADPWYYVGPNDVFPEEFEYFLGLRGVVRDRFLQRHGDLLTASYWKSVQDRHQAGEIIDICPYRERKRLRNRKAH